MSVERLIVENSTTIKEYSNLVQFLRVINVKVWEVLDFSGVGLQFLRWDMTSMVLGEDLLHEFVVTF